MSDQHRSTLKLHTLHERQFEQNRFVYPVLSRRSGGISIGVNLNPDKVCNFDCIYCQVDRRSQAETRFVEIGQLLEELHSVLEFVQSGELFKTEKFVDTPEAFRRLNDMAFSGDGEPTTYKNFDELIELCAGIKREMQLNKVKMVLISNASMFHRSHVQRGLEILDANQGEIWAKLDAGTEAYYQTIERTKIPFKQILENLCNAATKRPIVIQSLFLKINNEGPSSEEINAYCERLNEVSGAGGKIKLVQVYTVARRPAESIVSPLSDEEVDAIVKQVVTQTKLKALPFYGTTDYE